MAINLADAGIGEDKKFSMEGPFEYFAFKITSAIMEYHKRGVMPSVYTRDWIKYTFTLELPSLEWCLDSGWKLSQMALSVGRPPPALASIINNQKPSRIGENCHCDAIPLTASDWLGFQQKFSIPNTTSSEGRTWSTPFSGIDFEEGKPKNVDLTTYSTWVGLMEALEEGTIKANWDALVRKIREWG